MTGMELSRLFFFKEGLPCLKEQFPSLAARCAAGLFSGDYLPDAAVKRWDLMIRIPMIITMGRAFTICAVSYYWNWKQEID